jgi:hypothetical protein
MGFVGAVNVLPGGTLPRPAASFDGGGSTDAPLFIRPEFHLGALIGLGIPLYLVTMASQNLPGFATLRAAGYEPPVRPALITTGGLSAVSALCGAHPVSMAAITAAICLGDDVHPDKAERWKVSLAYGGVWVLLGLFGPVVIAVMSILPQAIVTGVVALALISPLSSALSTAYAFEKHRFAATVTFEHGAVDRRRLHVETDLDDHRPWVGPPARLHDLVEPPLGDRPPQTGGVHGDRVAERRPIDFLEPTLTERLFEEIVRLDLPRDDEQFAPLRPARRHGRHDICETGASGHQSEGPSTRPAFIEMLSGNPRRHFMDHRDAGESGTEAVDEMHAAATGKHETMGVPHFYEPITKDVGILFIGHGRAPKWTSRRRSLDSDLP